MKKVKVLIIAMGITGCSFAQSGRLEADSSSARKDTIQGTFVYLNEKDELKTSKGYVVREVAKMVFVGVNGSRANTDRTGVMKEEIFIDNKKFPTEGIIFFKPKTKK